jgi:hypothetical protein
MTLDVKNADLKKLAAWYLDINMFINKIMQKIMYNGYEAPYINYSRP